VYGVSGKVKNVPLDKLDQHITEAECMLEIVTFIAELSDEESARLRSAGITILYVIGAMLRDARSIVALLYRQTALDLAG
jgi:hypothetical protein